MKHWFSLLSIPFLSIVSSSATLALSGEEMHRYCADNACGGYFVGVFDGLRIANAVGDERQQKASMICSPDAVRDEVVVQVALDYLDNHPEARHLSAANLALRAWRDVWPCSPAK